MLFVPASAEDMTKIVILYQITQWKTGINIKRTNLLIQERLPKHIRREPLCEYCLQDLATYQKR